MKISPIEVVVTVAVLSVVGLFAASALERSEAGELEVKSAPVPDQCMRREIFEACLARVPKGPDSVQYNDWSEVVEECGSQAYYQALRKPERIKPECRL